MKDVEKFESVVQCPACGENVTVILEKHPFPLADMLQNETGLPIHPECFGSERVKCQCGKMILTTLTVTAMDV